MLGIGFALAAASCWGASDFIGGLFSRRLPVVVVLFTVELSGATSRTVTVDYATADGTATAGQDYAATSGMLIVRSGVRWFASGKYTGNVTLIAASRSTLVRSSDTSENR